MQYIRPVSIEHLHNGKYARVLCYPKPSSTEITKRTKQLRQLRVKAIDFTGEKRAFDLPVLGKGHVGVVVIAQTRTGPAALKIRRVDADRKEMEHEAEMLTKANKLTIGPRLLDKREDFLLMEFINGTLLPEWVTNLKGKKAKNKIRDVLIDILEQCYQLDQDGLDHGELSRAPKHIIVDIRNKPCIVDFETASIMRRASNVTSICQYLFMNSRLAKILGRRLCEIDREELVIALRNYKRQPIRKNFNEILKTCRLTELQLLPQQSRLSSRKLQSLKIATRFSCLYVVSEIL